MSNFVFIKAEWPDLHDAASKAEAYSDLNPQGPEGVFDSTQVDELIALLANIRAHAVA